MLELRRAVDQSLHRKKMISNFRLFFVKISSIRETSGISALCSFIFFKFHKIVKNGLRHFCCKNLNKNYFEIFLALLCKNRTWHRKNSEMNLNFFILNKLKHT